MRVLDAEPFGPAELLDALREVRLVGHGRRRVYADATLEIVEGLDPEAIVPAQLYALGPSLSRVLALHEALAAAGHDLFALRGGLWVRLDTAPGRRIPVIPPVVEEARTRAGDPVLLIGDGLHRLLAARWLGMPVSAVVARGVPAETPYYAYPLEDGWEDVELMDDLPDGFVKKDYVDPGAFRQLYRDFDGVLPGVQPPRKASDPPGLRA